jgi:hypothetical protein
MNLNIIEKLYGRGYTLYGPYIGKDGRYRSILYKDKTRTTVSYPKLLLECSLGRLLLPNETCDHKDGDFSNNSLSNLQVLTRRDNVIKAHKDGIHSSQVDRLRNHAKSKQGREASRARLLENNPLSLWSYEEVVSLRNSFLKREVSVEDIAIKYDTGFRTVKDMLTGKNYSHIKSLVCSVPRRSPKGTYSI